MRTYVKWTTATLMLSGGFIACTGESRLERMQADKNRAENRATTAARDLENEVCEMVNGRLECIGTRVKNEAKNVSDSIRNKASDMQDQVPDRR